MRVRPGSRRSRVRSSRQAHSFVEIWQWKNYTATLILPLIQEGQVSVTGERMCINLSTSKLTRWLAEEQYGYVNWPRPNKLKLCWWVIKLISFFFFFFLSIWSDFSKSNYCMQYWFMGICSSVLIANISMHLSKSWLIILEEKLFRLAVWKFHGYLLSWRIK